MKKFASMIFAVVSAVACVSEEDGYKPDTDLHKDGTVNLCASIEDLQTKMVMDATGKGMWIGGDKIAVACSDGSFVEFELNGTGETKRAIFTGDIPEGKSLGNVAVWPSTAVAGMEDGKVKLRVPTEYSTDAIAFDGIMVAEIGDSWEIMFRHVMSRPSFLFEGVPTGTTSVTLEADGYALGGNLEMTAGNPEGLVAVKGEQNLTISCVNVATTLAFTVNMPVGEYTGLKATFYNKKNIALHSQSVSGTMLAMKRAVSEQFSTKLEGVKEIYDPVNVEFIEVCGIKWAKGNLQVKQGSKEKGMQDGWRIAPQQWHYLQYQTQQVDEPERIDYKNNSAEFEHFSFGALARNARFYSDGQGNYMKPETDGIDIQGKIYADREGLVVIAEGNERWADSGTFTSNNSAIYGDLAYWASRGAYMTPSYEQMDALYTKADIQFGWVEADGYKVWGVYFTNPVTEGQHVNKDERLITEQELAEGIFLPKAGRRNNTSSDTVISSTQQATYRCSQYIGKGICGAGGMQGKELAYSHVLHISGSSISWMSTTTSAYDNGAGFLIRPVVNEAYDPDNI